MHRNDRAALGVLLMLAVLCVVGLLLGVTAGLRTDMPAGLFRTWWLISAVIAGGSGVGLLLGIDGAFELAAFDVIFGPLAIGLEALASGHRGVGLLALAFVIVGAALLKRSSAWFSEHERRRGTIPLRALRAAH